MRRDRDDRCVPDAGVVGDVAVDACQYGTGLDHVRQQAGGHVETVEQVVGPRSAARIEALSRRRVGQLGRPDAAEPVVHEVRDEQERLRRSERRVPFDRHRGKLEHGVDRDELNARALVQLPRRHAFENRLHRPRPAAVTVVRRILQQPALAIDEPEIDRPRVDGDRIDAARFSGGGTQPIEHVLIDAEDVPVERSPSPDRHIREAVDLLDVQPLTVERADGNASALRPEIDGCERRHQPVDRSFRTARRRSRGRSGTVSLGPGSTVMTFTPAARHASTSARGALESVTIPARSST